MVWIVIIAVLAVAIGPILWLLPSRRQRQLEKWRTAARRHGLVVEVTHVEHADAPPEERVSAGGTPRPAERQCIAYRLPLLPPLEDAPCWQLMKSEPGSPELPGWLLPTRPPKLPTPPADYWPRLLPLLDALPGGCIGVEATPRAISWFGLETAEDDAIDAAVGQIRDGLAAIGALHRELAAAALP